MTILLRDNSRVDVVGWVEAVRKLEVISDLILCSNTPKCRSLNMNDTHLPGAFVSHQQPCLDTLHLLLYISRPL